MAPPVGAKKWRLLRKAVATFAGPTDPAASLITEGIERIVLDATALVNGQLYYYALYWFDGADWFADGVQSVTPTASFEQASPDVIDLVRDRLDCGLAVLLGRGKLNHPRNHIQVLTAPPLFEESSWPVVTVHLQGDNSAEHGIGGIGGTDVYNDVTDEWTTYEGWLSRYQLMIVAWCLNPDQRHQLRRAIKDVLNGNRGVFDAAGMVQIDVSQNDVEDFQSYNAPVYQAMTTFSCLAPSAISFTSSTISAIEIASFAP